MIISSTDGAVDVSILRAERDSAVEQAKQTRLEQAEAIASAVAGIETRYAMLQEQSKQMSLRAEEERQRRLQLEQEMGHTVSTLQTALASEKKQKDKKNKYLFILK